MARTPEQEIVATLRFLAGGWVYGGENQRWLSATADQLEREMDAGLNGMMCCPLCEEVECDEGCPVRPHRTRAEQNGG